MTIEDQKPQDENQLIAERRAKLAEWRAAGTAYPNDFQRENTAGKLDEFYGEKSREELEATPISVKVAGRIMLKRVMGKASFATIQDLSGRIQIFVSNDGVGEEVHKDFKRWDIGDIVGCEGTLFKTKTGELTVQCQEIRLLSKALRPLPEKFHGLTDIEQKYRSRHLDLIMNEGSRFTFVARSRMIQSIRGHSFGGMAALWLLSEGHGVARPLLGVERVVSLSAATDVEFLLRSSTRFPAADEDTRQRFREEFRQNIGALPADFNAAVAGARLSQPALIAHDQRDLVVPYEHAQAYVAALPRAELLTTSGLGHRFILRDAAVVQRAVDFLAPAQQANSNGLLANA